MLSIEDAIAEVTELCAELDRRAHRHLRLERYYTGDCPLPQSIVTAQVTKAYRLLMAFSQINYGRKVVKSATSRMQIGGIRSDDPAVDTALWAVWQANRMDAESRRAHDATLTHGRTAAIIWPRDDRPEPEITFEDAATVVVAYREGSRYERQAAARRWMDGNVPHVTLYTAEAIYKFAGPKNSSGQAGTRWEPRPVGDDDWPLVHPYGVVPVVELATNRQLTAGRFGHAAGDFEHALGLLDRINVLEFLRLVIAFTAGFPIRAVIGDTILRDDKGKPIAPYKLAADTIAQFENPEVKLEQMPAADLRSFGDALDRDLQALAAITDTPAYHLQSVPIQNVSADAIRASDGPLNARIEDHKPDLAEGHEEVLRVAGLMLPDPVDLAQGAEMMWINRESRSLAERADAASKLNGSMPWQMIAEYVFDAGQDEIARWETMRAVEQLSGLLDTPPAGDGG